MRIIGGEYRGRKIIQPKTSSTRPTKDRIRESVFNMITEYIPGSRILDLFSGSGAYGLEALSRGADRVVFVENNPVCIDSIKENTDLINCSGKVKIFESDVFKYLDKLNHQKERFDIIFADPPYNINIAKKTLITINQYDILNRLGLLLIEHRVEEDLTIVENRFSIFKQKTYKDILVSIYLLK